MKDYPPSPKKKKKKKKGSGSLPAPRSGYATTIMVFFCSFTHHTIPDHYQNLISSSFYYSGPLHKISSQSVNNFLSNVHRQTDKQTDKLTNQRYQKYNLLCQGGNEEKIHNSSCKIYISNFTKNTSKQVGFFCVFFSN